MKKAFLFLLCLPALCNAQYELYNKGAAITVQKGALLHVQGTFTNTNGSTNGSIKNDGIIEVKGDLVNSAAATFQVSGDNTSTERAIKLVGSGTQTIQGSFNTSGTASIYNLVIDKANASDTVEMQTNVMVEGSLVFGTSTTTTTYNPSSTYTNNNKKGIIKTYSTAGGEVILDVENGNTDAVAGYPSLAINGAPTTGYVLTKGTRASANGGLQRKISSASSYVYPIGTSLNGFNAIRLNFSAIPSGGGTLKGKFCDGASSSTGYVGKISQSCNGCPNSALYGTPDNTGYNRYFYNNQCNSYNPQWVILESSVKNHGYWSFSSSNTGYQYNIEAFPNSYALDGHTTDTWRLLKYPTAYNDDPSEDNDDWGPYIESTVSTINDLLTYTKNTGCYTGTGIPGGSYTNFSHFTLSEAKSDEALPVQISYLKAQAEDNEYIRVSWATSIELNNSGFEVMRSTDGVNYADVTFVEGHGTTTTSNSYYYNDREVVPGIVYYYKLRQVDVNGNAKLTEVVSASLVGHDELNLSEFIPNPAASNTALVVSTSAAKHIDVKVYDMIGREVTSSQFEVTAGRNDINLEVNKLSDATYNAVVKIDGKTYSRKLVVSKN